MLHDRNLLATALTGLSYETIFEFQITSFLEILKFKKGGLEHFCLLYRKLSLFLFKTETTHISEGHQLSKVLQSCFSWLKPRGPEMGGGVGGYT